MKIAIDISPISESSTSAHKVRGVGSYINMLVEYLPKIDKKNEYLFIEDKKFPLDVDLIHYPYFDPFFITIPSRLQAKTLVTVHDLTPILFSKQFPAGIRGRIKWFIQKNRLRKVDLIITDSNSSKKDIQKIIDIPEDRIMRIYLGVDDGSGEEKGSNWRTEIQRKFLLPEDFILYVGDATWNKNLPKLISAVKKTNRKLVLVGKVWSDLPSGVERHPWNRDLIHVLREIGNDEQFIRLGFVSNEDLVKIYNSATALIMPSVYEGFGLPVLEAMSCGCPVITSRGGSLPEVAGDAAIYIDHDSEKSIVDGIERVFTDSKLRQDLSMRGLEQAKKFSIDKMIKELINSYEKTCS